MTVLLSHIRTTAEARQLRDELNKLLASLYRGESVFNSCLKEIRARVAEEIRTDLPQDRGQRQKYLEQIIQRLVELEPVELTLAFEPNEEALTAIFSFIQQQTGGGVILELHHDPRILG